MLLVLFYFFYSYRVIKLFIIAQTLQRLINVNRYSVIDITSTAKHLIFNPIIYLFCPPKTVFLTSMC